MLGPNYKLRGILLSAIVVLSLVGTAVTFTGSVAAANDSTLTINSVEPDPATVTGGEDITINYTATDVTSQSVVFLNESGVVDTTSISTGEDTETSVSAPTTNGTYEVQLISDDHESATREVTVDTEGPEVGLTNPDEEASETSPPVIEVDAEDNVGVESVEVQIQLDRNDTYYNGSGWDGTKQWVDATENGSVWKYDSPDTNGTYTVVARATDEAGNTTNSELDSSVEFPGDGKVSYTLDPNSPTFNNVSLNVSGPDRTVEVGENVTVTANVTDATSGVGEVTVDASPLGGSETLTLTNDDGSGPVWNETFTATDITVPDGNQSLTVVATDEFGLSANRTTGNATLDTEAAAVGTISIETDFIGVAEDEDVRVTATGVADDNGNTIDVGTVNISVADRTPFSPATVDDGTVNTTIDPTKLDNSLSVADAVEVDIAGTGATSASVELTHEVRTMDSGWHVGGTPMPAEEVYMTGDGTVVTYDKTAEGNWTQVDNVEDYASQPGAGYYFNITSEEARVGYTFEESSNQKAWTLTEGINLVGAVTEIDDDANATLGEVNTTLGTLKGYVASGDGSTLDYHIRNGTDDTPLDEIVGTTDQTSDSDEVLAYSSYIIEVETEGDKPVTYTVGLSGYDPTEKPN